MERFGYLWSCLETRHIEIVEGEPGYYDHMCHKSGLNRGPSTSEKNYNLMMGRCLVSPASVLMVEACRITSEDNIGEKAFVS